MRMHTVDARPGTAAFTLFSSIILPEHAHGMTALALQAEGGQHWLQWLLGIIAFLIVAGGGVILWNLQLRRTVTARTAELQRKNETLRAETEEKALAQKKLSTLLAIADSLIAANSFAEIGTSIFAALSDYDPQGKRGGKFSVYYKDLDLFRIEYLEHTSDEIQPTNISCRLDEVRYFSRIAIDENRTVLIADTHSAYALSIDPTLIHAVRSTLIFIPMYYQSSFIGLFSYSHHGPDSLDEQYVNLLESIAKYASIAIGELVSKRQREQAERALKDSERKYRTLFDESQDMVFEAELGGRVLDINPAGVAMLGYDMKEEVLELNISTDIFADEKERDRVMASLVQNGAVKDYEVRVKKKDGSVLLLEVTSAVVRNAQGHVESYRGIARDITLQKTLEEQLLHGQKMESLGTLAGGIAHEFNNVLAMILPSAEMIAAASDMKSKTAVYVHRIIEAANRGAAIAKQLLVFARSEKGDFKPVSLQRIVLEVGSLLSHTITKEIAVRTEITAGESMILGESALLNQAALNLALNAKEAMPEGGTLTLEVADAPMEEVRKHFPDSGSGPYLVLRVSDTGVGMDEKTRSRMFDPFFTTKEHGKGTGLGLSIVHGIVNNHHGYIGVDSLPGRGTTVSLYFPKLKAEAESAASPEGADTEGNGAETILVIDDEETIREMLSDLLAHHGYRVLTASNGVEGMERLHEHHDEIGLVLSDLGMPRMNGEQFFAAAKNFDPSLKIIISTGYLSPHVKSKLLALGVHDVVAKPFSTDVLLPLLRRALSS